MAVTARPTVLFLHGVHDVGVGGDSIVLLRTLEHLDQTQINPVVAATPGTEVWRRLAGLAETGRLRLFPLHLGVPPPGAPPPSAVVQGARLGGALLQLLRLTLGERVDVIYTLERSRAVILATIVAKALRRGLVVHAHQPGTRWSAVLPLADRLVVVSEELRRAYERQGISPQRIRTVHNGVDVRQYAAGGDTEGTRRRLGIDHRAPVVLLPGRLSRRKGQLDLVEAVPAIGIAFPDAQYVFAGADTAELDDLAAPDRHSMLEVLTARAAALGVAERAHFVGAVDAMPELYATADVVVLPALADPLPLVIIEAMSAGKPVVASAVGGIPEMVVHGETGLLVPPDRPDALAGAVIELLADPDLRARMGRAGQARARSHFSIERYSAEMQDVLLAVAAGRRCRPPRHTPSSQRPPGASLGAPQPGERHLTDGDDLRRS